MTTPDTFVFEARHGWIVRAALKGAQDMIANRHDSPAWLDDPQDGKLIVSLAVMTKINAQGAA